MTKFNINDHVRVRGRSDVWDNKTGVIVKVEDFLDATDSFGWGPAYRVAMDEPFPVAPGVSDGKHCIFFEDHLVPFSNGVDEVETGYLNFEAAASVIKNACERYGAVNFSVLTDDQKREILVEVMHERYKRNYPNDDGRIAKVIAIEDADVIFANLDTLRPFFAAVERG